MIDKLTIAPALQLGLAIRQARLQATPALSQRALAHSMGLKLPGGAAYISRVETGTAGSPRLDTLQRIAQALGLPGGAGELLSTPTKRKTRTR